MRLRVALKVQTSPPRFRSGQYTYVHRKATVTEALRVIDRHFRRSSPLGAAESRGSSAAGSDPDASARERGG